MRTRDGVGFGEWVLELLRTPTMIGATVVAGVAVVVTGLVGIAEDHKSSELICVEAGGDWAKDLYNGEQKCDMSKVADQ